MQAYVNMLYQFLLVPYFYRTLGCLKFNIVLVKTTFLQINDASHKNERIIYHYLEFTCYHIIYFSHLGDVKFVIPGRILKRQQEIIQVSFFLPLYSLG